MSLTPRALLSLSRRRVSGRLATAALLAMSLAGGIGSIFVQPASAAIGPVCPVPASQVQRGIDLCVDRGDNASYQAGDQITICVSANIPQIMIYPPPPPPQIKVEGIASDGSTRLLVEAQMASGQQCTVGSIVEPFGQETIRAQALGQDGKAFQEDTVTITTAPR